MAFQPHPILPLRFATLALLIVFPPARPLLFPPAPLAIVSAATGTLQAPKAGELATGDSLTGAAEVHKGEAVEQEAANFVSGVAHIALSSVAGKGHKNKGEHEGDLDEKLPDPSVVVGGAEKAKTMADGEEAKVDKTKVPVQDAMWTKARPVMRAVADVADGWERFAK